MAKWTEEEVAVLREKYANTPFDELVKILDRSVGSVQSKAWRLGLLGAPVKSIKRWTEEELALFKEKYEDPKVSVRDLDNLFKRSRRILYHKARDLGLKRPTMDETGNTYGQLVVKNFANKHSKWRDSLWNCRCSCGKIVVRTGGQLRRGLEVGANSSCGCARFLSKGEAAFNSFLASYRYGAKARDYAWDLTKEEFKKLINKDCDYCGQTAITLRIKAYYGGIPANGIDRIDNSKGYTLENCCSCCPRCNMAKTTLSKDDFIEMAEKIAAHQASLKGGN